MSYSFCSKRIRQIDWNLSHRSIVFLTNHQLAYILDSEGPIVIPFTGRDGNRLTKAGDPINLMEERLKEDGLGLDIKKPLLQPTDAFDLMPESFKQEILH